MALAKDESTNWLMSIGHHLDLCLLFSFWKKGGAKIRHVSKKSETTTSLLPSPSLIKTNKLSRQLTLVTGEPRLKQYRHQEFQFPVLDAVHCGTESEHQVSNGSLIGLFSVFILSPFTRVLEFRTN